MRNRLLCGVAALLLADGASAATVYSQPGTASCVPNCSISQRDAVFGYATFDNFRLSTGASVTKVTWNGTYFGVLQRLNDPPPTPTTTEWQLRFFSNAGGSPGTSLYSVSLPVASVTRTFLGSGTNQVGAYNLDYYEFSAVLPTAFEAAANTDYWFSPWSFSPDPYVSFLWSPSTLAYDGVSWAQNTAGYNQALTVDYAFTLEGVAAATVPEPETWALLIAGLGAIGLASRRRRAVAA